LVQVSLTRLPRLLGVLVFAFAPSEPRPLLAAIELLRGLSIQLAYRWGAGRVFAGESNQAVLLWSVAGSWRTRRHVVREVAGILWAVAVGLVLFSASNLLLLLLVRGALDIFDASHETKIIVPFLLLMARFAFTLVRAAAATWHHAAIAAQLPRTAHVRWQIDYLGATPARAGHGGRLLDGFLELADRADAEVVLNCDSRNLIFYRRHGFHLSDGPCPGGQRLMIRVAASARRKPRLRSRPS
jgi:hypothetical protein